MTENDNSWSQEDPPSLKLRRGKAIHDGNRHVMLKYSASGRPFCSVPSPQHSVLIFPDT